jgi:hypothetical protein
MSDQGNTTRNARIDDLREMWVQEIEDRFFWRALAIRLLNKYVFESDDHVAPFIEKEARE